MRRMKIGIDFDNTLVDYGDAFRLIAVEMGIVSSDFAGGRDTLRDHLQTNSNQEQWWQLQAEVYGRQIMEAEPFPGCVKAIETLVGDAHSVSIVSHKTERSYAGNYDLRDAAIKWLEKAGIAALIDDSNIYFLSSLEQKLEKLRELKTDIFLDDLPVVLQHEAFPKSSKGILFDPNTSVGAWDGFVIRNWTDLPACVDALAGQNSSAAPFAHARRLHPITGGINSHVYKLDTDNGAFALKIYPQPEPDHPDRMDCEINALNFLQKEQPDLAPNVISANGGKRSVLLQWLEGKTPQQMNTTRLDAVISFVAKLKMWGTEVRYDEFGPAREACFAPCQIADQIQSRASRLKSSAAGLDDFFQNEFDPVAQPVLRDCQHLALYDLEIDPQFQVLSPSDFGLHNTIENGAGELSFIDFEYFGWDDPAKLVADFTWHPSMSLTPAHTQKFIGEAATIFKNDPEFHDRLRLVYPLYGLRWALIVLNCFIDENWSRQRATENQNRDQVKVTQLQIAVKFVERVRTLLDGLPDDVS